MLIKINIDRNRFNCSETQFNSNKDRTIHPGNFIFLILEQTLVGLFLILAPGFLRFASFLSRRLLICFIIRGVEKLSMKYISDRGACVYICVHARVYHINYKIESTLSHPSK